MDGIGVIMCPNEDGKFDVYRIKISNEEIIELEPVTENRVKGSARRAAELELTRISQMFTRGQVEFGEEAE